jgi:hypothetical protein
LSFFTVVPNEPQGSSFVSTGTSFVFDAEVVVVPRSMVSIAGSSLAFLPFLPFFVVVKPAKS